MDQLYGASKPPNIVLAKDIISKISFPNFPLPIAVRLVSSSCIEVTVTTLDRVVQENRSPASIVLTSRKEVPPWFQGPQDVEAICRWVLDEVMSLLKHEVDEHFLLNGQRVFDPHQPVSRFPGYNPQQALGDLFPGLKPKAVP